MTINISAVGLTQLAENILHSAGFSRSTAQEVALHLVDAEAAGVASHGINRVAYYLSILDKGLVSASGEPTLIEKTKVAALVDGRKGIGIPAANLAVRHLIETANLHGVALAGIVNCGHTGRLGAYSEIAARAGCVLLSFGGAGRHQYPCVVPFGAREPFFSTNPFSLGAPGGDHAPAVMDIATSIVAGGKVAVAKAKGELVPKGQIVYKHGDPTTDPQDFIDGGALLPFGGVKGSSLGLMIELITTAMMGVAFEFNWLFVAVKADVFRSNTSYDLDANAVVSDLHKLQPAPGFDVVRMPGELEAERMATAQSAGLVIPEGVWAGLATSARRYDIDLTPYLQNWDAGASQ